jgi:hypothetical protein
MKTVVKMIRRWGLQLGSVVLACSFFSLAYAQEPPMYIPQYEVSGSYSFVRANPGNSFGGFNLNGGSATFSHILTDRFSVLGDFGAYKFRGLPSGVDSTMYTYLFGPRISLRKSNRFTPFAQALIGGGRLNASSGGIDAGENGFAMAAGGGIDMSFHSRWAIRLVQVDYLLTRFSRVDGSSGTQNDLRISTGLVFRFGVR